MSKKMIVWLLVSLTAGTLSVKVWPKSQAVTGPSFSLAVANESGIGFGALRPMREGEEVEGWQQAAVEKTELAALSGDELVRRLLAVKPEREVLKQYFSQSDWRNDITPRYRKTDGAITLIPQITLGGVDIGLGVQDHQAMVACQTEIARFLLRQHQRGGFALVVEGYSSPKVTQEALVHEMRRASEMSWDKIVAWSGPIMFGLNSGEPMASEGNSAEVKRRLWGQCYPDLVLEDPVYDLFNSYRDRVLAATSVDFASYTRRPVFVVADGERINGIQYQLECWQFRCRSWVPLAYRQYVDGRPKGR